MNIKDNKFKKTPIEEQSQVTMQTIFKLSWPVMIGMILQSLLNTVDTYFISNLGVNQAAAAGIANSITGVIFVISTLVSAGTIALVSRSYGENDYLKVKRYSGNSIALAGLIGISLGILCYLNAISIIEKIFSPSEIVGNFAYEYISIIFLGTVFVFLNSALRTIIQSLGDTMTPLIIFGFSNIINILLDYIFIFQMNMGIQGAAIATVISNLFSFIAAIVIVLIKIYEKNIILFIANLKIHFETTSRIFRIGGWACLQQVARPITGMLMFSLVYEVGQAEGSAAFNIGSQLFNYTFIVLIGLSTGISIMVGQSLGRGNIHQCDKIIKEGLKIAFINVLIFSLPYVIFPSYMMRIFIKDPAVISYGVSYLRIIYMGIVFVVFTTTYGGVFQGAGDTFPPMLASIVANVVFKLPLAYILAKSFNLALNGVWYSIALSVFIEAIIILFYFKTNRWKVFNV